MKNNDSEVSVYIPTEYFDELSEIIRVGLKESKISREARENLTGWWDAESDFIQEEIDKNNKNE